MQKKSKKEEFLCVLHKMKKSCLSEKICNTDHKVNVRIDIMVYGLFVNLLFG